jgi:PD-(D/E)XK nuclease superfamily
VLAFDEPSHTYQWNGARVPYHVTGVLLRGGLVDFDFLPPSVRESVLLRGSTVHRAIHFYNDRDLDVADFYARFPEWSGYLRAWVAFCAQRRFVPVLNEHRVYSARYQLAGTIDCLGVLDGRAVLVDFATGRPQDVSKDLQTAAYLTMAIESADFDPALRLFFDEHPAVLRYAVQLKKDATFRLEAYTNPADFRTFRTLLEAQQIVDGRRRTEPAPSLAEVL